MHRVSGRVAAQYPAASLPRLSLLQLLALRLQGRGGPQGSSVDNWGRYGGCVVSKAVGIWLKLRRKADDWSADLEPLAALAAACAERIDAGDVTGSLVKELRATLVELMPREDAQDAFELLAAELSATVHDGSD